MWVSDWSIEKYDWISMLENFFSCSPFDLCNNIQFHEGWIITFETFNIVQLKILQFRDQIPIQLDKYKETKNSIYLRYNWLCNRMIEIWKSETLIDSDDYAHCSKTHELISDRKIKYLWKKVWEMSVVSFWGCTRLVHVILDYKTF